MKLMQFKTTCCTIAMVGTLTSLSVQSGFAQEVNALPAEGEEATEMIAQPMLVSVAGGRSALGVEPPAEARKIEAVEVDIEALRNVAEQREFVLQLYDDEHRLFVNHRQVSALNTVISGHFAGHEQSQFAIAIVDDAVAGWFLVPDKGLIRLRYGGPGVHYLHEVDEVGLSECGGSPRRPNQNKAWPAVEQRDHEAMIEEMQRLAMGDEEGTCSALPESFFDILVVYTLLAQNAAGGVNAIRAEGALAVAVMTTSLQNTSLAARARVVWYLDVDYNEAQGYSEHLERLTDTSDGIMDNVHGVRAGCEADFVCLLVADSASGGLAWCDADHDGAFSVIRWTQAATGLTLAHEVGHNLGCAHNPEDADCQPYANANGHHFYVADEDLRRHSVMSYSVSGSSRIPFYSSPSVLYMGVATGTNSRNNQNRINIRRTTCANFRLTRMDVWVSFAAGLGNGSFGNPYGSLALATSRIQPDGQFLPQLPILHIKEGSSAQTLTIDKAMEIRACGGTVTIGQ